MRRASDHIEECRNSRFAELSHECDRVDSPLAGPVRTEKQEAVFARGKALLDHIRDLFPAGRVPQIRAELNDVNFLPIGAIVADGALSRPLR